MTNTASQRYTRLKDKYGRTRKQIRAVAVAREDKELQAYLARLEEAAKSDLLG